MRRKPTASEAIAGMSLGIAAALCLIALPMAFYSGWAWVIFLANAALFASGALPFLGFALVRHRGRLAHVTLLALGALVSSATLTGVGTWLLVTLDVV